MRLAFIVNPVAGSGRVRRTWPALAAHLRTRQVEWDVLETEGPGHAIELAREAATAGYTAVVAVGGDGTLNEVVNGVGTDGVPVGFIPLGTGVDFPRTAGLPRSPLEALEVVLAGRVTRIDVGVVNDRLFCNVAGTGFDAQVAARVNETGSKRGGPIPYIKAVFQTLFTYENAPFRIVVDGVPQHVKSLLMAVGNGRFYAGGMMICPRADLRDGQLDVCIAGDLSKLGTLLTLPRVFSGAHLGHPKITYRRAREVVVEGPSHLRIQADGELVGNLPATFALRPGALPMLLP
ncbi:MAG: diacylglycerol kinase family lipid kinase [Limnochordales bacterium]|nr:diacylglycerol kinase family protein [Sphingobacteriaceae bacterium]